MVPAVPAGRGKTRVSSRDFRRRGVESRMSDKESNGEGATGAEGGEAMAVGCSPASLSSPMSSSDGGNGDAASASGGFEPNCSLDKFMEALEALSPDGQVLHLDKRQVCGCCIFAFLRGDGPMCGSPGFSLGSDNGA